MHHGTPMLSPSVGLHPIWHHPILAPVWFSLLALGSSRHCSPVGVHAMFPPPPFRPACLPPAPPMWLGLATSAVPCVAGLRQSWRARSPEIARDHHPLSPAETHGKSLGAAPPPTIGGSGAADHDAHLDGHNNNVSAPSDGSISTSKRSVPSPSARSVLAI